MTIREEALILTGTQLARSLGHRFAKGCPKTSPAVPCTCGASREQVQALDAWDRLMQQIKES